MTLGLVGCGKMGSALIKGAIQSGILKAEQLFLYDVHQPSADSLGLELGASVSPSLPELAKQADLILLCTKPNHISEALLGMERSAEAPSKLIISIAAGVTIATLEKHSFAQDRIIRAMPNTPALVGKGAIGYYGNDQVTVDDKSYIAALFNAVGISYEVGSEDLVDAVTALSGSGPAYFYSVIESLAQGAMELGMDQETALKLATQTAIGAGEMLIQTGESPEELRRQVSSPGGTTLAGLAKLSELNIENTLKSGVKAAYNRAKELAQGS